MLDYPAVPDGLDWISVDYYPEDGTIAGAPAWYRRFLYTKMAPHQKAICKLTSHLPLRQ